MYKNMLMKEKNSIETDLKVSLMLDLEDKGLKAVSESNYSDLWKRWS